jgi:hypothetical protein
MNSFVRSLAALLLALSAGLGAGQTLKPVHADETAEYTLHERFSLQNALRAMESIQSWLESFRRLTAAAKGKFGPAAWKEIGNTEWDVQTLGFTNQPRAVEGALRYQDWQLKKTLHQLATMELAAKKTSATEVESARRAMEQAEKEFRAFWDSMAIAD